MGKVFNISYDEIKKAINKYKTQTWFLYAYKDWHKRCHVKKPLQWVEQNILRDRAVLETGCGAGINLLWLYEQGFSNIFGTDFDATAISAAKDIVKDAGYQVSYMVDDGLNPVAAKLNQYAVIIGLNWLYHAPEFDLAAYLRAYLPLLADKGYFIFDCIDSSYNKTKNNEYNTGDWKKPITERRPSEYTRRYSTGDVKKICNELELQVVCTYAKREWIKMLANIILKKFAIVPRNVFIVRKIRNDN